MFVGIILMCYTTHFSTCTVISPKELYDSEDACLTEGKIVVDNIAKNGIPARLYCHPVKTPGMKL